MIRPDHLLFGYYVFKISVDDIARASASALKSGITVKFEADGSFVIGLRQKKRVEQALCGISYTVSELRGLSGFVYKGRKRYGAIAAVLLLIFLYVYLQGFVWDVRIEGEEIEDNGQIIGELADAGLYVGARWSGINKSRVEAEALLASDSISWLNINRRGTVAYVKVIKKELHELPEQLHGYANIVAACDCIIEEITVKEGVAVVKVGESVKKGDLLISGVLPPELGGGYCYAEGSVKGRYSARTEVEILSTITEKEYINEKKAGVSVKIFGFKINILKKYGNLQDSCDIIDKNEQISLFGRSLPISVEYQRVREYVLRERELTADELTEAALSELRLALNRQNADKELISIKTDGEFTADGYSMWADTVVSSEVSCTKEFELIME